MKNPPSFHPVTIQKDVAIPDFFVRSLSGLSPSGWWFGTCLFSISYMGCHPSTIDEIHHFSRWWNCTTNQLSIIIIHHNYGKSPFSMGLYYQEGFPRFPHRFSTSFLPRPGSLARPLRPAGLLVQLGVILGDRWWFSMANCEQIFHGEL